MKIEILGMGCATCNKLEDTVRLAVKETGIDAHVDACPGHRWQSRRCRKTSNACGY
jgi:hypothetical protein